MSTPDIFPADDDVPFGPPTPDEDLSAAVESALSNARQVTDDTPVPLGKTWRFDYGLRRFVRRGFSPAEVTDLDCVAQWCMLALRVERLGYSAIFDDEFGMERAEEPVGLLVGNAQLSDLASRMTAALLRHDRVTSVEDVVMHVEGDAVIIDSLKILVDGTAVTSVSDLRVPGAAPS